LTGRTHLGGGLLAGAALAASMGVPPPLSILCVITAAFGAMLPDVDHPQSLISGWPFLGIISRILTIGIRHRGPTHSLPAIAALAAGVYLMGAPMPIVAAAALGGLSHLALDMLTASGVPLLWPLPYRFRIIPAWMNGLVWFLDGLVGIILFGAALVLMIEVLR